MIYSVEQAAKRFGNMSKKHHSRKLPDVEVSLGLVLPDGVEGGLEVGHVVGVSLVPAHALQQLVERVLAEAAVGSEESLDQSFESLGAASDLHQVEALAEDVDAEVQHRRPGLKVGSRGQC